MTEVRDALRKNVKLFLLTKNALKEFKYNYKIFRSLISGRLQQDLVLIRFWLSQAKQTCRTMFLEERFGIFKHSGRQCCRPCL